MAKFSGAKKVQRPSGRGILQTASQTPDTTTYEGAPAYSRDSLSELFLLGVANFVGEDTFYEKGEDRDARFAALSRAVAVSEPEWFAKFVAWLRSDGNMRSAPLVAAAEGVKARLEAMAANPKIEFAGPSSREIIASVLQRADEPGELVAYWAQKYGEKDRSGNVKAQLPKPIKRGIADKIQSGLYNQYSALKYDTDGKAVRFGDVLNLVHPDSGDIDKIKQFYTWLLDRRFGRTEGKAYDLLDMVNARKELQAVPKDKRKEFLASHDTQVLLKAAGVTWEWLASWLGSSLDAAFWEAMVPTLPYMATLRNLRNLDQAGVSRETQKAVAARLEDPKQVERSRQFPFRFLNAYKALDSLTYGPALETALDLSTQNIPEISGKNLILIDTSASMGRKMSNKSSLSMAEAAALFGIALAKKGEQVTLVGFASGSFVHQINKGTSVLKEVERFTRRIGEVGHGTDLIGAVKRHFKGHDRVFVFSDMQIMGGHWFGDTLDTSVPSNIPVYAFNLAGYAQSAMPTKKNRVELGGLTDATFKQIKLMEQGQAGTWPWEDEK